MINGYHHIRKAVKKAVKTSLARVGYEIRQIPPPFSPSRVPYEENPEVGADNLRRKLERSSKGGPFEWPDMLALNKTVVGLIGSARRIVEIGGGTGAFAYEAAMDPSIVVVCSELDRDAHKWAKVHRSRPNIHYINRPVAASDGPFDLVVSIDVIEHVADFQAFLKTCTSLAPKAIITTPNKNRTSRTSYASPPTYNQHVREWTGGEFYWVLRTLYDSVLLFGKQDPLGIDLVPMRITDTLTPLVAISSSPRR